MVQLNWTRKTGTTDPFLSGLPFWTWPLPGAGGDLCRHARRRRVGGRMEPQ